MQNIYSIQNKGFTLIELLISISVISLISVSLFFGYSTITKNAELKTTAFKIVDVLNLARTRTLASLGASNYGVHFEQTQYALFKGSTYDAMDPSTIFYPLPTSVEIADIILTGGGVDVVFDRLTGKTAHSGTLSVRLVSDPTVLRTIAIIASGRADITSAMALPPTGTRVIDSRHTHVTYNQSISSATTLTLDFPGYLSQDVGFQTYYNSGVFAWEGMIDVGGVDQSVSVHTHSADPSSAVFSVTRDARYNDKALTISLDGQQMITYTAGGVVALGSSPLVSDLAVQ